MQGFSSRSRRALLGWLIVVSSGVLMLVTSSAGAQEEDLPFDGDVEQGALLYAQFCAQCHAANGLGAEVGDTGRMAPPLAGEDGVSVAYVDLVMRTGRMPPAGENPFDNAPREVVFTDEERQAIVAYTAEAFDLPGQIPDPPEGDASRGQQVFATNCAACHGSLGAGGVAGGGAITPPVQRYGAVGLAEAIRVGPFEMPAFDENQISDEEIGAIAAFMEEAREENGTLLGLVELNPVYVGAFVAAMTLAMIFIILWIAGTPAWFPDPEQANESNENEQQEAS